MIVLDTNVVSAMMNPVQEPQLFAWLNSEPPPSFWTTVITVFEIRFGIASLPDGRKKRSLNESFDRLLVAFAERILVFDRNAAEAAGWMEARRKRSGFTDDVRDIQIAAIAQVHGATIATRNVRHFADLGPPTVDPWSEQPRETGNRG